jgi:hypothetical protein
MRYRAPNEIDLRPETLHPDRGCAVSPKCIACPLEVCRYERYERGDSVYKPRSKPRDQAVMAARDQGQEMRAIMGSFGISESTYRRIIRRPNNGGNA